MMDEAVLLHPPSGTLLCADLVFNVRVWHGVMTGLMLRVMGTRGRLAASRVLPRILRDRAAFWASLLPLRAWDFRRILMGHGEAYESPTARADLLAALEQRLGPGSRIGPGA